MEKQAKFLKNESEKAPLILVVGDHSDHSSGIDESLIEAGYRLRQVSHGENELEVFSSVSPNLILLDIPTPDKDAYETCRQIREMPGGERIPILFMIGSGDDAAVELAFAAGATDFIGKPICFTVLKARIRNLLKPCQAEQRFTALAQSATDGIISIDNRGIIRYVNHAMETIFGYSASEIEGRDLSILMPEEFRGLHTLGIQRYLETRQPKGIGQTVELQGLHKNGDVIPMELSLSVTETAGETSFTGIIRNISERLQAKTELEHNHQFLRTVLESLSHPFYVINVADYSIQVANSASSSDAITMPTSCHALTHKKDHPCGSLEHPCPLEEVRRTKKKAVFEHIHYDESGDLRTVEVHAHPIFDSLGNVTQVIEYSLDITDRIRLGQEIAESRAYLENVLTSAPDAIVTLDGHQIIRSWNPGAERLFGYSKDEAIGQNIDELVAGKDASTFDEAVKLTKQVLVGRSVPATEILRYRNDGLPVHVLVSGNPIYKNEKQIGAVAVYTDISKRIQAEEELREREIFLNTLLDTIPIPIFYKDRDGRYLGFNPAFETFFGAAREKLIGKSVFDINPPKLAEIYHEKDMELIEGGGLQQYQSQVKNALGDLRDVIFNKAALLDIRGDVGGIIGAIFDITDRLEAEIILQESQARYAHIFENAGVGIWVEDFSQIKASIDELKAQGVNDFEAYFQENPEFIQQAAQLIQIRDVNQAALDLFGAKNKAELLASLDAVLVPETQEILRNEILAIANEMRYFKGETVNRTLQGELIHILVTIVFPEDQDRFEDVLVSMMDISERVQAEKELQSLTETLEERVRQRTYELQVLHELSQEISYTLDYEELFHRMLSHLHRVVDYDVAMSLLFEDDTPRLYQRLNRNLAPDVQVDIQSQLIATFERMQPGKKIFRNELSIRNLESLSIDQSEDDIRNETPVAELNSIFQVPLIARSDRQIVGLLFVGAERAAAFSEDSVRLLYTLATQASLSLERLRSLMYVEQQRLESLVERIPDGIVLIDKNKKVVMENPAGRKYMDHLTDEFGRLSLKHLGGHDIEALLNPREDGFPHEIFINTNQHQIFEVNSRSIETGPEKGGWVLTLRDVTWERDLLASERTRRRELDALYRLSREMAATDNLDDVMENIAQQSVQSLHVSFCRVLLTRDAAFHCMAVFPAREFNDALGVNQQEAKSTWPIYREVLKENMPLMISNDHPQIPDSVSTTLKRGIAQLLCLVPMRVGDEPIGILMLGEARDIAREPFTEEKLRLASAIGDQAASAIHRATLHFQTQQRLNRILALRQIDIAITSSVDIEVTLSVLVKIIQKELNVDAVNILLLNSHIYTLKHALSSGFSTRNIEKLNIRIGEGLAGRAALERHSIRIDDLASEKLEESYLRALEMEDFSAYCGIPLIAKGKINGVLEIYHHLPLPTDMEWTNFLETLAGQTAIAIDSAEMYQDLQRSNRDLMLAYDATIEGWSNALELRDMETEGHSQRVTHMTVALARLMGIGDEEITHIRRGALLHDIGKMGIPDNILHKPGQLSDDEWGIMHQHPVFAYNMLAPIRFLRQALDIPHYHHERWDGTGYPERLKETQIPLGARIFAIIDVWDALSSDRPYREAWPKEKIISHIQTESGKHFDPKVVEAFLELIGDS